MDNRITKECWLAFPGPNLVDYNWHGKVGTRIGIDRAATIIPGCHYAIASSVEGIDWLYKNLSPVVHVWKKQSYVKYTFKSMSVFNPDKMIRGSIIIIALQLIGMYGGKTINLIDCNDCEEYESIKKIVDTYGLKLNWEGM